jgi:ABC-type phosphate transport system permease subunit
MTGNHIGRRLAKDALFKGVVCLLAFLSLLPLSILYYITMKGISVINWIFSSSCRAPSARRVMVSSTPSWDLMLIVLVLGPYPCPAGIAAGIYLSENKAGKLSNTIRSASSSLQGTPR